MFIESFSPGKENNTAGGGSLTLQGGKGGGGGVPINHHASLVLGRHASSTWGTTAVGWRGDISTHWINQP